MQSEGNNKMSELKSLSTKLFCFAVCCFPVLGQAETLPRIEAVGAERIEAGQASQAEVDAVAKKNRELPLTISTWISELVCRYSHAPVLLIGYVGVLFFGFPLLVIYAVNAL